MAKDTKSDSSKKQMDDNFTRSYIKPPNEVKPPKKSPPPQKPQKNKKSEA